MLTSYIKTLPSKCKIRGRVIIPDRLRQSVGTAMKARNQLAHTGRLGLNDDTLETLLRDINDILWLLDLYAGHRWQSPT
jgi:hypothetical protein